MTKKDEAGIDPARYAAALRFLFDRPEPGPQQEEWYWGLDEEFDATQLEWTRIQARLFAHAGEHLRGYTDRQVAMGLNYLMSNGISDVPYAAIARGVPMEEAMRMMQAMPALWRDCIGPRLAQRHIPIGSGLDQLGHVCHMWFDVWPTFRCACRDLSHAAAAPWRAAMAGVLVSMLDVPCREVQVAGLHGIGHHARDLDDQPQVGQAIDALLRRLGSSDAELATYAEAARRGAVQ